MNITHKSLAGLFIALALSLSFSACERRASAPTHEARRYELKGKVVAVDKANKRLHVNHEEIKDFMAAMTMWFAVKDDAHFAQIAVGDQITATLIYHPNDNRSWLENLKIVK